MIRNLIIIAILSLMSNIGMGQPIKSIMGATHQMYSTEAEEWMNPYVTDGLVAMWDGEWNAGGGIHNDSPNEIKDIVGESPLSISPPVEIGMNYFRPMRYGSTINATTYILKNALDSNDATIEICAMLTSYFGGMWFFADDLTRLYNADNLSPKWLRIGGSLMNLSGIQVPYNTVCTVAVRIGGTGSAYFVDGENKGPISKGSSTIPSGIHIARNMAGTMYVYCVRISSALTDEQIAANAAIDQQRFNLQ